MTTLAGPALSVPRDVSTLLRWLREGPPGVLIPAGDLLERIEALPLAVGASAATPNDDESPEPLMTAEDVAEWLQIDVQSVYRRAREQKLPSVRIGANGVRFRRSDIERWLDRRAG